MSLPTPSINQVWDRQGRPSTTGGPFGSISTFQVNGNIYTYEYQGGDPSLVDQNWRLIDGNLSDDPDTTNWGANQAGALWYNRTTNTYRCWNGTAIVSVGGGGSAPTGDSGTMAYFNTSAPHGLTDDTQLFVSPIDQFGRPQIKDNRANAGTGSVYRQGSWQTDGDPTNQMGEGIVIYGQSENGNLNAGEGGYARVKSNRFGLGEIIPGVNGGNLFYYFRVDPTSLWMTDALNNTIAQISRPSGAAWFKELHIGSAGGPRILTGAGNPNGSVTGSPGDLYTNTSGGAGTTLYVKESGANTNTGWVGK